ncbi:type IX secretion system protein PorD [Flavobacterium subsaxonicum]|uniref:DUF4835 domain-containing protein n=1 Tax=Flavobacterium subsaxonicum WB 4.1-42 = DSM 21790 TaxID=1121898 RepID=A0A0A2MIN1_9FLAO|nr:DUF4835 family protein [Flavobacterium subsaxonicum]KGO92497.1 hypothetical protein Q766_11985 [Flavobacterium subsaxonicum WB 4.1-42 = DSM 21790]
MHKWIGLLMLTFFSFTAKGQELNCTVKVSFDRITDANPQIFKTLEKSLQDFVNNTRWTTRNFGRSERIDCSMFFNISAYDNNSFTAMLQVASSRSVYNSTYQSPVMNVNDKDIAFRYNEGENLIFNPNSFDSNLVSLVAFYANMIIAMDADTYEKEGGTPYYEAAQNIVSVSQSGGKGWTQQDGLQSRYFLVNDVLSNTYKPFREALYAYHMTAMDKMADNQKEGKEKVIAAITTLSELYKVRPNAFLTRVFFDAKSDEIVAVFSGGPMVSITKLQDMLNRISPMNGAKWGKIK